MRAPAAGSTIASSAFVSASVRSRTPMMASGPRSVKPSSFKSTACFCKPWISRTRGSSAAKIWRALSSPTIFLIKLAVIIGGSPHIVSAPAPPSAAMYAIFSEIHLSLIVGRSQSPKITVKSSTDVVNPLSPGFALSEIRFHVRQSRPKTMSSLMWRVPRPVSGWGSQTTSTERRPSSRSISSRIASISLIAWAVAAPSVPMQNTRVPPA